jgi:hypothetical protein
LGILTTKKLSNILPEEVVTFKATIIAAGVSTANIHSINEPYKFVFTLEICFLQKGLKHTTAP